MEHWEEIRVHLKKHDQRFEVMDHRFDAMDRRFDSMEGMIAKREFAHPVSTAGEKY